LFVEEALLPDISRRQRKLNTGKDVAVRRNIATGVAGAARQIFQRVFVTGGDGAEFFCVADQRSIAEDLAQFIPANAQA